MVQFLKVNMRHLDRDNRGRKKRHKCLIVANEFPALKRMKAYELLMKRFAQYGIKSFKTVQSFNDIKAAYGPYSTIRENCHVTITFASADPVTQKEVSGMLGKDTEYRTAENLQGSRFGLMLGNKSVVTHEVYREIVDAGDVRELDPNHEFLIVTGYPKFKAEKVRYDQEPVFRERLLPAAEVGNGLGDYPDLPGEIGIEWLGMRAGCLSMPRKPDPRKPPEDAPKADRPVKRGRPKTAAQPAHRGGGLPEPPEWAEDTTRQDTVRPPADEPVSSRHPPAWSPARRRGVTVRIRDE
jgi:type IV secretion system protein VirD4